MASVSRVISSLCAQAERNVQVAGSIFAPPEQGFTLIGFF